MFLYIKSNVLISDDGETPILMDFGSACQARVEIHNRQEALKQQVNTIFRATLVLLLKKYG